MGKSLKIGSAVGIIAAIVGLIFYFNHLNSEIGKLKAEKKQLDRQIVTINADKDSLLGLGTYIITDTLWDSIPAPYPVHDTLPPNTVYIPWPRIRGHITIDTFKTFGPDYDPLSVKITGKFHFPEQEPDTNWLKIVPSFKKAPYVPLARRQKSWGLGLVYIRSASVTYSGDYLGASVQYKRLVLSAAYDPWRKATIGGISYFIFGKGGS